ncbi:MAG TPA: DNA polymerase III subunit gamma/tau [Pyrinomonadaceae bacterium]|nr:DNA polymerase III subunit gamma/tau [Pyrinomonadaceae bacterium]
MSYQVIARKWRPQSFAEVTGQEPITRTLTNAIVHDRLHHAYLFSGARGVGKTTTARLFAKGLNCHKSPKPTATPCRTDDLDACPSCREISESRSMDVLELDAASHTQVENVRESIIGTIGFAPARDRFKIFIIDEVHMLSSHSFNALLKTVEEPPERVVFIMATTERHKVPETIQSRSQQFEFRTIPTAKILERLRLIASAECVAVPDEVLREIARAGEGSMRDAQSAFDQVISFSGPEIKMEDVELALGIAGAEILKQTIQGIAENNPAKALSVIDDVVMRGHDLRNFCRDLLAHFRDLLVTKVAGSEELLESAICDRQELKRQAALFSESDLVRFFHSLADTETKLQKAAHPRYQLEIGLVKLMEMKRLAPINELFERLERLEKALSGGAAPTSPPPAVGGTTPPTVKRSSASGSGSRSFKSDSKSESASPLASTAPSEHPDGAVAVGQAPTQGHLSDVDRVKGVLETKRKMFLVTALESARVITINKDELYLEFSPDSRHLRDTLAKGDNARILREACQEALGREIGVRIMVKESSNENSPLSREDEERLSKQRLREAVEKDPVVQQLVRTFRGEIVDVRQIEST